MKTKQFKALVKSRLGCISAMLTQKGKEYASDTDRLHNFKRAAKLRETTPEDALMGFFMKHLTSVLDMVDEIETKDFPVEYVNEKLGDCINYLILLEALLAERRWAKNAILKDEKVLGTLTPLGEQLLRAKENKDAEC